jgi:hypothetical protein
MSAHNFQGNCWKRALRKLERDDVCTTHEEPRGDCDECPRCPACDEEDSKIDRRLELRKVN